MYFDTHAHFDLSEGPESVAEMVRRCREQDLSLMVAIGGNTRLNAGALAAARCAPDWVWVALGLDRDQASSLNTAEALGHAMVDLDAQMDALPEGIRLAAVGEIGLDYHYEPETAPEQRALFSAQLALARKRRRPVVVHSRDADEDTLTLLSEHQASIAADPEATQSPGVLHCFTGNQAFADALVAIDMFVSFSGIVTFRNADSLRAVARSLPEANIVIETDSPYLAPVPMRGKRNEPHYVRHVCALLAELRGTSVEYMAQLTRENGKRLFA